MDPHDELDLLSEYLDGELEASDRARLDAHIPSCVECSATLAALRTTLAELRALPQPAPTPQDSWAIRAAVRRGRSPRRWQRASWAAGAVAAAVIAFAAVTLPGGNGSPALLEASRDRAETGGGMGSVPIFQSGENLAAADAQALLLSVANIVPDAAAVPTPPPASPGETGGGANQDLGTYAITSGAGRAATPLTFTAGDPVHAQIASCVEVVRGSTQELLQPIRYDLATFEGEAAFLLFFRSSDRYELWVVGRDDCTVLYFAQAGG